LSSRAGVQTIKKNKNPIFVLNYFDQNRNNFFFQKIRIRESLVFSDGALDPVDVVGHLGVDTGVVGPGTTVAPADDSNLTLNGIISRTLDKSTFPAGMFFE